MPEPANTALDDARKRARRRLVGAIVLALIAAVIVPLFLESDPKPLGPDVQIQIPAIDDSKFQNRLTPSAKGGATDKAADPAKAAIAPASKDAAPLATPTRPEPATPAGAEQTAAANPSAALRNDAPLSADPAAKTMEQSTGTSREKSTEQGTEKSQEKAAGKSAEKSVDKSREKSAPKAAQKTADSASESSAEKAMAAEKTSAKGRDNALAKAPPEPPHTLGTATLNTAPPAPPKAGGEFVVQVGAYVDKAVATELAAKVGEQGYPVYLEPVTTKSGRVQRVRVGPFPTREAADAAAGKLAMAGFTAVARPR